MSSTDKNDPKAGGGTVNNHGSSRPTLPPLSLLNNALITNHTKVPPSLTTAGSKDPNSTLPIITNSRMSKENNESQSNDHSTPDSSVSSRSPSEYLEVNLLDKEKNLSEKSLDKAEKSDKLSDKSSDQSSEPPLKKHQQYAITSDKDKDNHLPKAMTLNEDSNGEPGKKLAKRFFCKTCNQAFTRKHNMVSHELIHTSLKPHICSVCNAKFRRIHDLKRHEKLHTGAKPYHCDKCGRSFARPDALTRHQSSPNACLGNKILSEANSSSSTNYAVVSTSPLEEQKSSIPGSTDISDSFTFQKSQTSLATSSAPLSPHINDTIKRENYDMNRLKAYQYQIQLRKDQPEDQRFSETSNETESPPQRPNDYRYYNTTTTVTTTTTTTTNRNRNDPHGQNQEYPPRGVDASPAMESDGNQSGGPVYGSRVSNEHRPTESLHSDSHGSQSQTGGNGNSSPNLTSNSLSGGAPPKLPPSRATYSTPPVNRSFSSEGLAYRGGPVSEGGQQQLQLQLQLQQPRLPLPPRQPQQQQQHCLPQPSTFYERPVLDSRSNVAFLSPNSASTSTYNSPNLQNYNPNQNQNQNQSQNQNQYNGAQYSPHHQQYPSQQFSRTLDSGSQYSDVRNPYPYPDPQLGQRKYQHFQLKQFQQRQQFELQQYDEKQRFMKSQEMAKNYAGYADHQPSQKKQQGQQQGSQFNGNFVPMASYQDLVKYTQELQANLSKMNTRLKQLEDNETTEGG